MQLVRLIDRLLNGITMYRLLMYGLGLMAGVAILLSALGALPFPPLMMVASLAILVFVAYGVNLLLAIIFDAVPNAESSVISALILFFILPPPGDFVGLLWIAGAAVLAMASKYLLAWRRKHIFNPAALAAAVLGLTSLYPATWWVATPALLPAVLIGGLLVLRKVRRFQLYGVYATAAIVLMLVNGLALGRPVPDILWAAVASWPLIFFGTIMVPEPSTMPVRWRHQVVYACLVGSLFASQIHFGPFFTSPEVVLLIGNVYAFMVNPKYRLRLKLIEQVRLSDRVSEFRFQLPQPIHFAPGQYMEFTLPMSHTDGRGNRRTFSIASSPTESQLKLGIKFYEPSSTFKQQLRQLKPGATLMAGQLAGNFILPGDLGRKLVFVAGGIGITPFRSMLKQLIDTGSQRDIILLYAISAPDEISFRDVLDAAAEHGVRVVPILGAKDIPAGWKGETGYLTAELIQRLVPDLAERHFFISGPSIMVDKTRDLLRSLKIRRGRITTDYFSGY
jgi:glycine betaine catabolism B